MSARERQETWGAGRVILLGLVAALSGLALFAFNPSEWAFFPRCPFHLLTGLHCPGCGTQRALHLLLHGDVAGALHHNALTVLSLPLLAYVGVRRIAESWWQLALPSPYTRPVWLWALVGLVVAFLVLRNLPALAFLAPPG